MAAPLSQRRTPDSPSIPDRLYFKIGDVARICDVEAYVLRFWETQFPQLKPNKSGTGQRLYKRRDVELALEIKRLVYAEGYTLSGARQALNHDQRRQGPRAVPALAQAAPDAEPTSRHLDTAASVIGHARAELREIAGLLASPAPRVQRRRSKLATVMPASDSLFS
jgi:DNA-binding transcriptional MerR regulator